MKHHPNSHASTQSFIHYAEGISVFFPDDTTRDRKRNCSHECKRAGESQGTYLHCVGEGEGDDIARTDAGGDKLGGGMVDELIQLGVRQIELPRHGDGSPLREIQGRLLQQSSQRHALHFFPKINPTSFSFEFSFKIQKTETEIESNLN